jgi:predicted ATP-dependent endonuclease of OLD family
MATLVSCRILGYGRLLDCSLRLDQKVVAIVGPNEAGKTTVLEAIEFASDSQAINEIRKPRNDKNANVRKVTEIRYKFSEEEQSALAEKYQLESVPSGIVFHAYSDGQRKYQYSNKPVRRLGNIRKIKKLIGSKSPLEDESKQLIGSAVTAYEANNTNAAINYSDYETLISEISSLGMNEEASTLSDLIMRFDDSPFRDKLYAECVDLVPPCLLFNDDERLLLANYQISEQTMASPSKAFVNLLAFADTTPNELLGAFTQGTDRIDTLLNKMNKAAGRRFTESWHQSDVTFKFSKDGRNLFLRFEEPSGEVTTFDSRSLGMRSYLALLVFLHKTSSKTAPVLLIDEAENHLHIDAQVDLIQTFQTQELASKIIYTTHSPACLPKDLGSSVKALIPVNDFESKIENNFLKTDKDRPFPLSFAMGASASAFSAYKYALITEGMSDSILLPTLLRLASGLEFLRYYIVPGLSEASPAVYSEFEVLAAKVAYLVDGDDAGTRYKEKLMKSGILKSQIISLPTKKTLEDLIIWETYIQVFIKLLSQSNPGVSIPKIDPSIKSQKNRSKLLGVWCKKAGLNCPSKSAVAYELLESSEALLSASTRKMLQSVESRIESVLEMPT